MERFGEKLRALRKRDNITLKELATQLEFSSYTYLNAIELGRKKPSVDLVLKLSRLFDVSIDVLMKDELEL